LLQGDDFGADLEQLFGEERRRAQAEEETEAGPEERELQQLVDDGGLDLRSKWGLRFARANDGAKSAKYTGSRSEKQKFREDWLKAQLSKVEQVRVRSQTYKSVNFTRGVYRPFSVLYRNQGGPEDPGAMLATLNIARSCLKLGGQWTRFNSMSKRMEFFELEAGWEKDMENAWSLFEKRPPGRRRLDNLQQEEGQGQGRGARQRQGQGEGQGQGQSLRQLRHRQRQEEGQGQEASDRLQQGRVEGQRQGEGQGQEAKDKA